MTIKTIMMAAGVAMVALGVTGAGMEARAAHDVPAVTAAGIAVDAPVFKKKCVKKPKTVPGTGGPMLPPPGVSWC
jgi:hypothetical protein